MLHMTENTFSKRIRAGNRINIGKNFCHFAAWCWWFWTEICPQLIGSNSTFSFGTFMVLILCKEKNSPNGMHILWGTNYAQMEYGWQLCCMQKFTSVFCRSFETDLSIAISFYLRKELVGKLTMYVFNRRNFELRTRYIDRTKRQNHSSYRSRPRGYRHVLFTIARSHKSVWNSHFHCNQLEE